MYFLVQPHRNRPAEFARCTRCPPGACQRRLLPLPVSVMLIFGCFLVQVGDFYFFTALANKPPLKGVTPHGVGRCPQGRGDRSVRGGPAKLVEGFFSLYSSQPISQGVTLLFFFTEKKKRSKKRKEFAFHLYYKIQVSPEVSTNKNPPAGHTGGLLSLGKSAVAITAGRRADPPLYLCGNPFTA